MIVSFSVSNFRSFAEEQTLSLVASGRLSSNHPGHTAPIPASSERLLRTAVIYGANGAGKSNLFAALRALKSLAINPRSKNSGTGRVPFQFSPESHLDTELDLQFIASEHLYRFGLRIDDHRILEEWLVRIENGKERVIYERKTSTSNEVSVTPGPGQKPKARLKALYIVGGPGKQTFLPTAKATLKKEDLSSDLLRVSRWFSRLTTISPEEHPMAIGHHLSSDAEFRDFSGRFLSAADTGVGELEVIKDPITEEELRQRVPDELMRQIKLPASEGEDATLTLLGDGSGQEFLVDPTSDQPFFRLSVRAVHTVSDVKSSLPLSDESDGTRRLLDLIPTLHATNKRASVFVIDEIDRSLHPILVRAYLQFFLDSCQNSKRQLILTTHDSTLLDLDLLRRDEIWFAEKNDHLATTLYSLSDFKVRNDLEIGKHYLQGRFGAIPFLGDITKLLPVAETPACEVTE